MEHIKIVCKIPHEIALQDGFLSKLIRKMERQVKNTRKSIHMTIEITWGSRINQRLFQMYRLRIYQWNNKKAGCEK